MMSKVLGLEAFAALQIKVHHAKIGIQLCDHIVVALMSKETELLFGGRSTMHDGIAAIGGHHHHLVVGKLLLELTYLGQSARPFGDVGHPMQFTGLLLLEGTPVLDGVVVVILVATLVFFSVRPRRH